MWFHSLSLSLSFSHTHTQTRAAHTHTHKRAPLTHTHTHTYKTKQNQTKYDLIFFVHMTKNNFVTERIPLDSFSFTTEGSMLDPKPCVPQLCFLKPSIWLPSRIVLTCWMHDGFSLNPVFKRMYFASFDCSWDISRHQRTNELHYQYFLKFLFYIHQSFALLSCFCLWTKHGGLSSRFLRGMWYVMFWLAEGARVIWQSGTLYHTMKQKPYTDCWTRVYVPPCLCSTWLTGLKTPTNSLTMIHRVFDSPCLTLTLGYRV